MAVRGEVETRFAWLAVRQHDVVARWQLLEPWRRSADRHAARRAADRLATGLERMHDGVYLAGFAAPTVRQRHWAAVLTAPGTVLADKSAAVFWEIAKDDDPGRETVVRPGVGSPRESLALWVRYSQTLEGVVRHEQGLPVTSVERTIISRSARVTDRDRAKLLREALRLGRTTLPGMRRALTAAMGQRGVAPLRQLVAQYEALQLHRCRSDAEARAMELLGAARLLLPEVNVRRAGLEADLSWPALRLIVEIDGPSFHVLRDADAHRTAAWTAAGWRVVRVPSSVVFGDPAAFIALVVAAGVPSAR